MATLNGIAKEDDGTLLQEVYLYLFTELIQEANHVQLPTIASYGGMEFVQLFVASQQCNFLGPSQIGTFCLVSHCTTMSPLTAHGSLYGADQTLLYIYVLMIGVTGRLALRVYGADWALLYTYACFCL